MVLSNHASPNQKLKRFSPRKDSPSRQLDQELNYALEQLVLHDHEVKKVHAYQRRTHHAELEARETALAKSHMAALEAASARHDAVRHEAEVVLYQHVREQEEIQRRKEAEEKARQEQEARDRVEREQKAREAAERKAQEEKERHEAEEFKAKQQAEERARAAQEEAQRKEQEVAAKREEAAKIEAERVRKQQEDVAKAELEKQAAVKHKPTVPSTATPVQQRDYYAASTEAQSQHSEYLALHKKLKEFRKTFWESVKTNKTLKSEVGDMRRAMRTSVGQLTDDKVGNKKAQERVKSSILKALGSVQTPALPVNDYLPPHLHHPDNPPLPSLIIYLLSIFSKAIVAAFTAEVAVNPRAAEPIGTLTAQVFSMNELQLPNAQGSLVPILMAKFHASAPILFGVSGVENTAVGRIHLGWRTEGKDNDSKKSFVIEQRHHERMTGLGAGYASIALRNFSRTKLKNPYPPTHFWRSLSFIVNTPPQLVTTSHILLLKSMLDNNAPDRFMLFFGSTGIAGLREALIEFPKRLPEPLQATAAVRSIGLMVDGFAKERHFRLT